MNKDFVGQEAWDERYRKLELEAAPSNDCVRNWIERFLPDTPGSCLELGCFPGRYLAAIAEHGYEIHGIDRTPRVVDDLPRWFEDKEYQTGSFAQGDVFEHAFDRSFDLVCSFGLIEHFEDWPALVRIHAKLVAPGGLLLLTAPNFRGTIQRFLHGWLDGDNLREHNLNAMIPSEWGAIVRTMGFEIVFQGHFGRFDFWMGDLEEMSFSQRAGRAFMRRMKAVGRFLPEGPEAWTPYCGLVARKQADSAQDPATP